MARSIPPCIASRTTGSSRPSGVCPSSVAARSFTRSPRLAGVSSLARPRHGGGSRRRFSSSCSSREARMRMIRKALRRVQTWLRPRRFERELDEELSFHLEMQTRWHESRGMDPATARALAAREFGGETRFKEAVRDARGLSWAHDLSRDVRFALRSYRRSPAFTVVALLTLTLGIGITTAAFSVIDAVLLRPLPYPEPDRIVSLTGRDSVGNEIQSVSAPNFYDWRDQSRSFAGLALYSTARRGVAS